MHCHIVIFKLLIVFSIVGIVSGQYPLEEGPLTQMTEAVANIDKCDTVPGGPCTPNTPGMPATPNTPGTGHKSPRSVTGGFNRCVVDIFSLLWLNVVFHFIIFSERTNKDFTNDIKTDFNLEDLNFDPAAIIGDNNGDWNVSRMKFQNVTHNLLCRMSHQIGVWYFALQFRWVIF